MREPATGPGPGQQYGFRVDLDACTGCKACVAACHSLNGLDDGETWRAVGLVVGKKRVKEGAPAEPGRIQRQRRNIIERRLNPAPVIPARQHDHVLRPEPDLDSRPDGRGGCSYAAVGWLAIRAREA